MRKSFLVILPLLGLIAFLRAPFCQPLYYNPDVAQAAVSAAVILDGGVLYRDVVTHHGPLGHYLFALFFRIFGLYNVLALNCALTVLVGILACLVYRLSRSCGHPVWVSGISALLFAVFSYAYYEADMLAFNEEWLAAAFSGLGGWAVLEHFRRPRRWSLVLAGIAFGLAALGKQSALADLAAAAVVCLAVGFYSRSVRKGMKDCAALGAGVLSVTALIVGYFWSQGALRDLYFWFWEYNVSYYVYQFPFLERLGIATRTLAGLPVEIAGNKMTSFVANAWILWLFLITQIIFVISGLLSGGRKRDSRDLGVDIFLGLWGMGSLAGALFTGRNFGHYYILVLIPLCLAAGRVLLRVMEGTVVARTVVACVVVWGVMQPFSAFLLERKPWLFYTGKQPLPSSEEARWRETVDFIKRTSGPEDRIFIWGFDPRGYALSERLPATRFCIYTYLTGFTAFYRMSPEIDTSDAIVPGSWDTLMTELETRKPLYIIDASTSCPWVRTKYPISKFPRLQQFLDRDYRMENTFAFDALGNNDVYRRKF